MENKKYQVICDTPDFKVMSEIDGENSFERAKNLVFKNIATSKKYGLEATHSIKVIS